MWPVRTLLLLATVLAVLAVAMGATSRPFPQMLELSTRPWLYSLSSKYGRSITKLSEIPEEEVAAIRKRGFDVVWMMGVWQLGQYGLHHDRTDPNLLAAYAHELPGYTDADIIGSPYAIVTYTVNTELGSVDDLRALRTLLAQHGLKLMLDFVPNHSAVDCPWAQKGSDYYMRAPQRGGPYDGSRFTEDGLAYGWAGWGAAWTDTLQFNYWSHDLRAVMLDNVMAVASVSDYIRCDMAFLMLNDQIESYWNYTRPPTEFWEDAIAAVKHKFPDVHFLAEVYDPFQATLQSLGFDFTYDKDLYDRLGDGNLDSLRSYISNQDHAYMGKCAHFVENHDEPRAAAFFGSNMRADAAAMVSMTLPGMRFYFQGQREGYTGRLDVHLRRAAPEAVHEGVPQFYDKFTRILAMDIFHQGDWSFVNVLPSGESWRLMAWKWVQDSNKVLCVVNYSDTLAGGNIIVDDATPGNDGNATLTELLSGQRYTRSVATMKSQGLTAVVAEWSMQIFSYQ